MIGGVELTSTLRREERTAPQAHHSPPTARPRGFYDVVMALERITVDPARMGGVPCIRDLRVSVSMVLGQLAGGRSVEELLVDYPYLEHADVMAALEYAAAVVNEHEVPIARPA